MSGVFNGKTVVVTGAGSGVGRGLAMGFARDGATVIGIGRTERDLAETAALCGGALHFVVGDVRREADVERLFAEAERLTGRVDVLVNNAAVYPKTSVLEGSVAEWIETIEVNVIGMYLCCRRALPGMLARGHGRILNMGSFAYRRPIPNSSAYAASKGAVRALTRAIAVEIDRARHPDVLVNELLAGVFQTRMSDTGEDPAAAYPHARFVASLPAGGPHGQTFVRSEIHEEDPPGLRTRVLRKLRGRRS
jgi:NAD(P)-dependent dehydrogenase (short-subunit alcohol dehydrogenase family)